jgi:hypothetical protein
MSKKVLKLTIILLIFSAGELQAAATHSTWVGDDGDEWGNARNWDPSIVPDNSSWQTFAVTISTTQRTRVQQKQNRTINRLDCYGHVDLEKSLNCQKLSLMGPAGLTNHGKLEFSGQGDYQIVGNVRNTSGAYIRLTNTIEFDGEFTNNGDVLIVLGVQFYTKNGSFINSGNFLTYNGLVVAQDYDLENLKSGVIEGFGVIHSDLPIRNQGTIYANGGSLALSGGGPLLNSGLLGNSPLSSLHIKPAVDVNNFGTIEVNAGGGVAFDCNMVNEPNAVIKLLGGTIAAKTITQSDGASFEGFGGITGNVIINPNGIISLTGPTNIVGDVTIENNAVLEISNGQTLIVGHTINNGEIRVVNGDVVFQGGYSGKGTVKKD